MRRRAGSHIGACSEKNFTAGPGPGYFDPVQAKFVGIWILPVLP